MKRILAVLAIAALAISVGAAPQVTAEQVTGGATGGGNAGLALANATIATFPTVGDLGESATITRSQGAWYGAAGVNDGNAIPALTNNLAGGLEALANDFPTSSGGVADPAVTVDFDLGAPANIDSIIIWSENDADGRANHHVKVATSGDGVSYTPLITVVSEPDGAFPSIWSPVALTRNGAVSVIDDDGAGTLVTTQYVRFEIYAVSNTAGAFWDEYDNAVGADADGQALAFETSVIQEIEIIGTTVPIELAVFGSE